MRLKEDPLTRTFMQEAPSIEIKDIVSALAIVGKHYPDFEYSDVETDDAVREVYPLIAPNDYKVIAEGASWLGKPVLEYLAALIKQKYECLDNMMEVIPADLRADVKCVLFELLSKSGCGYRFSKCAINEIRYSKRMGTLIVLDPTADTSETVFAHDLRRALVGQNKIAVLVALSDARGCGIWMKNGSNQFKCTIEDVAQDPFWGVCVRRAMHLPLPLGTNFSDRAHIVDLGSIDVLVAVSADMPGMSDFIYPIFKTLPVIRNSRQVRFLGIDLTDWALNPLWNDAIVPRQFVVGPRLGAVSWDGNVREISDWVEGALSVLSEFEHELVERRRIFEEVGGENFNLSGVNNLKGFPHLVCCIAGLPWNVKSGHAAYDDYKKLVDKVRELVCENLSRYGMHVVLLSYSEIDPDLLSDLQGRMWDGDRVEMAVVYGNYGLSDSYALLGNDAALRVRSGMAVLKSSFGDISYYCPIR